MCNQEHAKRGGHVLPDHLGRIRVREKVEALAAGEQLPREGLEPGGGSSFHGNRVGLDDREKPRQVRLEISPLAWFLW
jgi:hypothetical protein